MNFTRELLLCGVAESDFGGVSAENALERYIAGLFLTPANDPGRKLSKKEILAINDCIKGAQKVWKKRLFLFFFILNSYGMLPEKLFFFAYTCVQMVIRRLKAPEALSEAVKKLLGHLFLREAHPKSFLMVYGACLPTSANAIAANGSGFCVPLSGASSFYIQHANTFYKKGGFDAILHRLVEKVRIFNFSFLK
jgi:hypothetical protein